MNNKYHFNGEWLRLATSSKVKYSKSDFQEHLFTKEELEELDKKGVNYKSHQSLIRSGRLMIKEFNDNILPKIKKVIGVQIYYKIANQVGDEIFGYADLICEWEDGRTLLLDIKTSSTKYGEKAILEEEKGTQTAIYYSGLKDEYNLDGVGFLVLHKKILKGRGKAAKPHAKSEIVIGNSPKELIQKTFDQYDTVAYNIKMGNFPCAAPRCDKPWGKCVYKNYCESGGCDTTGLVKVGKEK